MDVTAWRNGCPTNLMVRDLLKPPPPHFYSFFPLYFKTYLTSFTGFALKMVQANPQFPGVAEDALLELFTLACVVALALHYGMAVFLARAREMADKLGL